MSLAREFSLCVDHAFTDRLIALVYRDPSVSLPAQDASALNDGPQEQPVGQNPMVSGPPLLHNTTSTSPPSTPQVPSQEVNYRSDRISPESQSGGTEVDESRDQVPHTGSEVASHDTSSEIDLDNSVFKTLQDNLGASGMLLVSIPPTRTLHWWRFGSGYR